MGLIKPWHFSRSSNCSSSSGTCSKKYGVCSPWLKSGSWNFPKISINHVCVAKIRQKWITQIFGKVHGLAQDCSNSSGLAVELLQSCAKPLKCSWNRIPGFEASGFQQNTHKRLGVFCEFKVRSMLSCLLCRSSRYNKTLWAYSIWRWRCLTGIEIPIVEIWSLDGLISTMGIPMLVRLHLYIQSAPDISPVHQEADIFSLVVLPEDWI